MSFSYSKLKRVTLRSKGGYTDKSGWSSDLPSDSKIVGWMRTKQNVSGFALSKLTASDEKWLKETFKDTSDMFRMTGRTVTSVVRLNLEKGTVAYFDNEHYMATDEPKFGKFVPYSEIHIDCGMMGEFGVEDK